MTSTFIDVFCLVSYFEELDLRAEKVRARVARISFNNEEQCLNVNMLFRYMANASASSFGAT